MSKLGPEARAILAGARSGDDPTAEDRMRVRRAIRRSLAAGGAAATSAAASAAKGAGATKIGTLWAMSAGKVISVVALVSAVAAGSAIQRIYRDPPPDPRPSPARIAETARGAATPSRGSREVPGGAGEARGEPGGTPGSPAQAAAPAPRPDLPPAPAIADPLRSTARPRPSTAAIDSAPRIESAPSATDPLERETASLEEAHSALRSGDPARALDLLDRQSAAYRDGQLREERAAARVLALCKLGRMDEARAAAAAFVQESPRSPLVDRVRAGCPAATR